MKDPHSFLLLNNNTYTDFKDLFYWMARYFMVKLLIKSEYYFYLSHFTFAQNVVLSHSCKYADD